MPEISPEWTAELKKGSVQLCLLALLAREQKYGFQILKELRALSDGFFDLKEGTLSPALRRLEERGFDHNTQFAPEAARIARNYPTITEKGNRALAEALEV